MAVLLTQCLFYVDAAHGVEYCVDRSTDHSGQIQDDVSSAPYGTALLALMTLDPIPLKKISKIGNAVLPIHTVEEFAHKRGQLRWALEQTETLVRVLPDPLRLYRARTLHLIATCLQASGGNTAMLRLARNGELQNIYTVAEQMAQLCVQLQRLLQEDLFSTDSHYQTPAQRTQKIFELLGADAATLFAFTSLPFEPYILDLAESGPTLCMLLQLSDDLRPLVIVMLADLIQGHQRLVRCGYCDQPFVPAGKAVYCDRVQDAQGNTCKQLGAMARYRTTLEQDAVKRAYRQAYKRNFSRMRSGRLEPAVFEHWKQKAKRQMAQLQGNGDQKEYLDWLVNWKP